MRLLIDHGSANNLGDTAMLEGVVTRLHRLDASLTLCVRDRPGLRTRLWDWKRVTPVTLEIVNRSATIPSVRQLPYLWRYEKPWQALWRTGCHALLDRLVKPGRMPLREGGSARTLEAFCQGYDALHIVGGGNLTDTFPDELWQRCCLIHTFAAQHKPVLLSGQQLGPLRSWWTRDFLRRALRKATYVGLREPTGSLDFCRWANLTPGRYSVMGDDSFGCDAGDPPGLEALLARYQLNPGKFLAANVRIAPYIRSQGSYLQPLAQLISALSRHYRMPAVVIPIALNREDSDLTAGHQLRQAAASGAVGVVDEPELSLGLARALLGKAFAAVGASYHFCVFALSRGVPALCTFEGDYYSQKARGLARFWGDGRIALSLTECSRAAILGQAIAFFNDFQVRDALSRRAQAAVNHWHKTFDDVVHNVLLGRRERRAAC